MDTTLPWPRSPLLAFDQGTAVGGVFRPDNPSVVEVRALRSDEIILNRAYYLALDAEGRPVWPFRKFYIQGATVFAQRWRLGRWLYDGALDPLITHRDDQWIASSEQGAERWIKRAMAEYGIDMVTRSAG